MDPTERYYFGDLRLWQLGLDHVEAGDRAGNLSFEGVDRKRRLVIPASPNVGLELLVRCVGSPNPASVDRKGFRAALRAMRVALEDRADRADPVVWIEDDRRSKTVTGWAAPTVTCAAHGYANGDVVLVRRLGAGLWSLATVSNVAAGTFDLTAVTGTALHAIAAADEIHLVEGYWLGMVASSPERVEPGEEDWWAEAIGYRFVGSGSTTYARTAAAVGS